MTNILTETGLIEVDYDIVCDGELSDKQIPSLQQVTDANIDTQRLWIDGDSDFEKLSLVINKLNLIAIHFSAFTDGRGYSLAFKIRKELGYQGNLLAFGDVLVDQLSFMKRVGFDQFWLRKDQSTELALTHFNDFKAPYQSSITPDTALFER